MSCTLTNKLNLHRLAAVIGEGRMVVIQFQLTPLAKKKKRQSEGVIQEVLDNLEILVS